MNTKTSILNDHGEIPKRLTPSKEITGLLFLMSGNRCAYPGCGKPILQRDGLIDGEIAHICAPVVDGPRYDPTRSNEQNRTLENLFLLCNKHHKAIDLPRNLKVWSVDRLREVKADHEKIYTVPSITCEAPSWMLLRVKSTNPQATGSFSLALDSPMRS